MPYNAESKVIAKQFVADIRAETFCESCGAQPIEWHRVEHETDPNQRVSGLAMRGYPLDHIQAEINRCQALCRSCHMKMDGRMAELLDNRPFKKGDKQDPKPCSICGKLTNPQWKGKCRRCYDKIRRAS